MSVCLNSLWHAHSAIDRNYIQALRFFSPFLLCFFFSCCVVFAFTLETLRAGGRHCCCFRFHFEAKLKNGYDRKWNDKKKGTINLFALRETRAIKMFGKVMSAQGPRQNNSTNIYDAITDSLAFARIICGDVVQMSWINNKRRHGRFCFSSALHILIWLSFDISTEFRASPKYALVCVCVFCVC